MARLGQPSKGDDTRHEQKQFGSLVQSPELAYLNRHYGLSREVPSGGGKFSIKAQMKRLIGRLVFGSLTEYLTAEHEYLIKLVRFQNEIARRLDASMVESHEMAATARDALRVAEEALTLHRNLEERMSPSSPRRS